MAKKKETKVEEKVVKEVLDKVTKKKGDFKVIIETNGEVYETLTNDIASAIQAVKAPIYKTQTVFKVTYGNKTVERVINVPMARRLFSNPLTAIIFESNLRDALNAPSK